MLYEVITRQVRSKLLTAHFLLHLVELLRELLQTLLHLALTLLRLVETALPKLFRILLHLLLEILLLHAIDRPVHLLGRRRRDFLHP